MTTAHEFDTLASEIESATDGMTATEAASRVSDPAARFAVQQTLNGGALPRNGATLVALRTAHRQLTAE